MIGLDIAPNSLRWRWNALERGRPRQRVEAGWVHGDFRFRAAPTRAGLPYQVPLPTFQIGIFMCIITADRPHSKVAERLLRDDVCRQ